MNRLKRTLAALTAAIVCTMGTPAVLPELADTITMTASAAEELTYGDLAYEVNDEGTISITGCDKSAEVVEIPAQIDGKAVTGIDEGAFSNCTSLTNITIPESVTVIWNEAFSGCTSLTSITIPKSVTEIGWGAFSGCTSLTSITIPEGVTWIGDEAFSGCTSLTSITIPESATYIGRYVFSDCTSLTSITIPESATGINFGTFSGCTSLTSITIPENVTDIGEFAFYGCESLTSVTMPESVTYIGRYAFCGCTSLTSIKLPESVIAIGHHAFSYCTSLTSITIPESVTELDLGAFADCTSLTSIQVDSGNETYVSEDGVLFTKDKSELICCPGAKEGEYVIPESVTAIWDEAFSGCTSLTSITIPEGVTYIGEFTFYGCTNLTSITIPKGVTKIRAGAFSGCTSLMSIEVDSGNESYVSEGGVLFNKDKSRLVCYPGEKKGAYVIPESVTEIDVSAFSYCTSLTSITIPEGVTVIGWDAFYGCTSLMSIEVDSSNENYVSENGVLFNKDKSTLACYPGGKKGAYVIPESVTEVATGAFRDSTSLTNITIPESVTEIGWDAFYSCTSLTDVYYTGTEDQWNAIDIWEGNEPLTDAAIHFNSTAPVEPDFLLGDVNGDDIINASDAAVVLIAAAQIGASEDPGLTEAQRKSADVNKDGKINASDAAVILMYAAAVGAGDENAKIEDFV